MNNVEIDDIYHHDFTTTSEWEVFIARLEEIIHEWKLSNLKTYKALKEADFNLPWEENTEKVNFADVEFSFKYYRLKVDEIKSESNNKLLFDSKEDSWTQCQKDILNATNDFAQLDQDKLEIARLYGIREFLLLMPTKQSLITDETRIKILLSSLTVALSNTYCEVAAFVQVQEHWQKFYLGVNIGRKTRMHLNMVHLKKIPSHCRHLTGLLTLFKQKIGEGCGIKLDSVLVSVRLSYSLKDWSNTTWTQDPPDFEFMQGETVGVDELGKLPFGATFDPIKEFHLFVSWLEICENVIIDSEGFSDLEPLTAPQWSLQVEISSPICLLNDYLSNFLELCSSTKSLIELLGVGAAYTDSESQSLSSAFNILTESRIPSISTVVSKTTSKNSKNIDGPITEDVLLPILYFLFPDAEEMPKAPYDDKINYNVDDDQWKGVKTCAINGLIWRLAIVAAHCAYNLGSMSALAQLWYEFVQEVRFRWEKCIPIPGIGPGFPDCVRTCLLHQKLQMINCCIARKKMREECERKEHNLVIDEGESSDDSEDDEFFECLNEEANDVGKNPPWNRPVGRLAKHPTLRLVQTGEALYLPVTQDPVPKTEDQLEEDAEVMMQLGTDKTASMMRARLMSASLLSDMESFKAANPLALLDDFIKWYSPHDWIAEDSLDQWGQPIGHLSQRMLIKNNPWSSTWESAEPVPAHRQKRLFDDTREAEKVLHYLASKNIGQIGQLLLPVLVHAALVTLHDQVAEALPMPEPRIHLQSIRYRLQTATTAIRQKLQTYEEINCLIGKVEVTIAQMNSLRVKLTDQNSDSQDEELISFLHSLMGNNKTSVPNGYNSAIRTRIANMFYDVQKAAHITMTNSTSDTDIKTDGKFKSFPAPVHKEFILRATASRPSSCSIPQPHRLYVSLKKDAIHMAGAFSEDTIFF
ncbi:PREDICTED: rab3 GTPase-activating protein catalytic subunit [Ceratosolen solmsi marchali]|uniref:Rab3 GTPase-activating protein catalytic subunit n=1 Tax=Ceratosolen solmsi marchali TaxID=326594 RepID=A0AAJ6YY81_9HYME|nr:PREDICTED: rab3 GTPase-activating protein catalytic subunit [Ceratosolen solmsi marchali]